jgi:putative aldouronate transport system substrate-binding protein
MKVKKILSVALGCCIAVGTLGGCSNNDKQQNGTTNSNGEVSNSSSDENSKSKLDHLTIMVDGTLVTKVNARDEWEKEWEKITGVDLEIIQPDHDAYYDIVGQTFAGGDLPDVILLGSTYYAGYAGEDVLWDMTEAYENSDFKNAGRVKVPEIVEASKVDGKLYGLPVTRGNGCVTYVKKTWLDNIGMDVPTNYDEYLKMLDAFTNGDPDGNGVDGDTFAIASAGIIGKESPFVNYLPDFYQDAYPSFYQKEDGTWVDGFTETSMKEALVRLREAYTKGYLDKESLTQGTKDCRTKFYEDKFGVFTYWAGKWNTNMKDQLEANGLSGELIAIPPVANYQYRERVAPNWCITAGAKDPQAVFDLFFETLFDGKEGTQLWTYGVKGIHWDNVAETVLDREFKEGEFHFKEQLEFPGTFYTTAHVDPLLSIISFDGEDPGADAIAPEAKASQEVFNEHSFQQPLVPSTDEMSRYNGDLTTLKNTIVANIVTQGADYDSEMKRYVAEGGQEWSELIVDSLNK